MIRVDDVLPLLLAAVPSFGPTWDALAGDPLHVDDDTGTRLHHLDAGAFAAHLVARYRAGDQRELRAACEVLERLHAEGDDAARELVVVGCLEGVQTAAGRAGVDPRVFEAYLGPRSLRWWRGLDAFWSGRAPAVLPVD